MNTPKKPTYQQLKQERDMWEEDFHWIYDTIMNMGFWERLKFLIRKGDI